MPKMWRKGKIMTTVKVTPYVTYLLPASFFSAEKVEAIPERNPQQQAVDAPKEALADVTFFPALPCRSGTCPA